jgi:predicted ATP-dependent serine protease
MAKSYVCRACGCRAQRYMGRCPKCSQLDTMVEQPDGDAGVMAQKRYRDWFEWKYELAVILLNTINPMTQFSTRDDLYIFLEDQGYRWDGELWNTDTPDGDGSA